ncbi:MAG: hypothetical protein JXR46_07695 [Calditrichaceae bacterium]|nr:hypothetical protein [Calditrichaceae bacterium]MBN2708911.1 hypothetical protein [Calditrichaceae bacterium]RQV97565.1 MAG: hypothetical protein EH224_00660 [Calditrichota bacterium]
MIRKSLYLILFTFLTWPALNGQVFIEPYYTGNGARSSGMGKAFTGLANDATAIAWNAAGLIQLNTAQSCVAARFGYGSVGIDKLPVQQVNQWDVEINSWSHLNFIGMGFSQQFGETRIGGGLAFRRIYNLTRELKNTIRGPAIGDSTLVNINNVNGSLDALSIALAFEIFKSFSIGVTNNILFGGEDRFEDVSYNNESVLNFLRRESFSFSGYSAEIGLMFIPIESFTLGANLRMPYSISANSDQNENFTIEMPFNYTMGMAFSPFNRLTLTGDFGFQAVSSVKIDGIEAEAVNGLKDNHSVHAGIEYHFESGQSSYPLRFGYYRNSGTKSIYNPDYAITGGAGMSVNNFQLNLALEYAFCRYNERSEFDDFNPPLILDAQKKFKEFKITVEVLVYFVGI